MLYVTNSLTVNATLMVQFNV